MSPSKYLPAWEKLKADNTVTLIANPIFHARIKKALHKRKEKDKGYRNLLRSKDLAASLTSKSTGAQIVFTLTTFRSYYFSTGVNYDI